MSSGSGIPRPYVGQGLFWGEAEPDGAPLGRGIKEQGIGAVPVACVLAVPVCACHGADDDQGRTGRGRDGARRGAPAFLSWGRVLPRRQLWGARIEF